MSSFDNAVEFLATAGWVVLMLVGGYLGLLICVGLIAAVANLFNRSPEPKLSIEEKHKEKRKKLGYYD